LRQQQVNQPAIPLHTATGQQSATGQQPAKGTPTATYLSGVISDPAAV